MDDLTTLEKGRAILASEELIQIESELREYLKNQDITELTMLNVKYTLTSEELISIINEDIMIRDLNVKTDIKMHSYMEYGVTGKEKVECISSISLLDFAKSTIEMIEYVRNNICNDDFSFDRLVDYRLFALPESKHDRPTEIKQDYKSTTLKNIEKYKVFQDLCAIDLVAHW